MASSSIIPAGTRAVIFDAYGTLFDVHAAVGRHMAQVGPDAARFSDLWRAKQLEYSWVLTLAGRYEPFWSLTEKALDHALARFPDIDPALRRPLLEAYRRLDAYPEVRETLSVLRARCLRTGILSNGDPGMLNDAVRSAGLAGDLDIVLSVDAAQVFKTSPRAYELVLQKLSVAAHEVVFVSSNRWDIAGAAAFGFNPVWVNRLGLPDEYVEFAPSGVIESLRQLIQGTVMPGVDRA